MAKFIGSALQSNNWGEDYFIKKLVGYFDDSFIIYRNRPVFGAQFDICLLVPGIGIIIFEVKAWKPDTIKKVKNGDTIIIKTVNEETNAIVEAEENPTTQVRAYVYKMVAKIRQKTGKTPLVYGMVCFPNLTKADYDIIGIEPVCEYEETILRDDLESKANFFDKINLSMRNHRGMAKYNAAFTPELMFRVRQIFETDLKVDDYNIKDTDLVKADEMPGKTAYSIFACIPHDKWAKSHIEELSKAYSAGTKLYLLVSKQQELAMIKSSIDKVIKNKGLVVNGLDLEIDFSGNIENSTMNPDGSYIIFNCSAYIVPGYGMPKRYFTVVNGRINSGEIKKVLEFADNNSNFNIGQFLVEHCDINMNAVVRAGAGTGKTYTMISRIAFICYMQTCAMKEMANRIVMLTFTDVAANNMKEKIKKYFNNYYLLTGNIDCLDFINQIEGMQISTIHSYAKKIISHLGIEFGYGTEVIVTSGDYKLKQIIAETIDSYIVEKQRKYGMNYIRKLGMPVYQINKIILNMLARLHNQSINAELLSSINFGVPISKGNEELHELVSVIIPEIEKVSNAYFKKENKVHLSNIMSILDSCIKNENNVQRLMKMQMVWPQFMFVDEFQDTDDVQIDILMRIARLLKYKLFVVGDVKQCIYRFRGAKENAFERLDYKGNPLWKQFSLSKNYRTDKQLLDIFHNSFAAMGKINVDGEQLLMYDCSNSEDNSRLTGVYSCNSCFPAGTYYKKISVFNEQERLPAVFLEIDRQKKIIHDIETKNGIKMPRKEKEIAILVRENWQAGIIREEGKSRGIEIITNTGGTLYMSEPALDMLKLANALLHYDEASYLYALVTSNFINCEINKARMYTSQEKNSWKKSKNMDINQTMELQIIINKELSASGDCNWKDWNSIIKALRVVPVLQVLHKIYNILKPWVKYGKESKIKQDNYRLNVDLLFEEIINSTNMDSVSINSIVDILTSNIASQKNVDSREPDIHEEDIVIKCVTVHKSKGLEYGAVILPYCSSPVNIIKKADVNVSVINGDMLKAGYQIKYDEDHITKVFQNNFFNESLERNEQTREEARILYVAMTRAIRSFSWIALESKNNMSWQNLIWEGE